MAGSTLPRALARALMAHASGRSREWLVAHGDERCPVETGHRFDALAARARAGEPLAYLLGEREFFGLGFRVGPAVLIPRPETEMLVQWAIRHAAHGARVADLGTGSGAIAVALAHARPDLDVLACDRNEAALGVARANAARHGVRVRFGRGHWWGGLRGRQSLDVVLCNPPYVADGDPHLRADGLPYEPADALVAGHDGLAAIRDLVGALPRLRLASGARLLFEHGADQARAVRALLAAAGLRQPFTLRDDQGRDRVTGAAWRG